MAGVEHQLARRHRDRHEELRIPLQKCEQPLLHSSSDTGEGEARSEPLRKHRRRRGVAVVQLVSSPQRLDHDRVAVDPAERLDGGVQSRRRFLAQPAEALGDVLAGHAQDQRPAETLHQEVEGSASTRFVFDADDGRRGGDRPCPARHRSEVLSRAEDDLVP